MRKSHLVPLSVIWLPVAAGAQVVSYTNFGSDSNSSTFGYDTQNGWLVGKDSLGQLNDETQQFTAGLGGTLADVILPLELFKGGDGFRVELSSDVPGSGTVLENWNTTSSAAYGTWALPRVLTAASNINLVAGSTYWVTVYDVYPDTVCGWMWNEIGATGQQGNNSHNGDGFTYDNLTLGALQVDVQPAAEPASLLALIGLAALVRRRR